MYRALGLDTLKKQKEHHKKFINKQEPPDFPKEVMEKIKYGSENEVK